MQHLRRSVSLAAKLTPVDAAVNCIWIVNTVYLPAGARVWGVCFHYNQRKFLLILKLSSWQVVVSVIPKNAKDTPVRQMWPQQGHIWRSLWTVTILMLMKYFVLDFKRNKRTWFSLSCRVQVDHGFFTRSCSCL